jgi:hypothetical protein
VKLGGTADALAQKHASAITLRDFKLWHWTCLLFQAKRVDNQKFKTTAVTGLASQT